MCDVLPFDASVKGGITEVPKLDEGEKLEARGRATVGG
jgi:hypothetical protein